MKLLPILLLAACVPQLETTEAYRSAKDWSCAENAWSAAAPPEALFAPGDAPGFHAGARLPDGVMLDQHGDEVCMWQFYGRPLVIDVSPEWCPPCKELACYARDFADSYADQGLQFIGIMPQNGGTQDPTVADVARWASTYNLASPVLADVRQDWSYASNQGDFPTVILVDETLTVRHRFVAKSEAEMRFMVEKHLGLADPGTEPHSVCD